MAYDIESDTLTVKNGNFNAKMKFEAFILYMIAKNWRKYKNKQLPAIKPVKQAKPVLKVIKAVKPNIQAARYQFRQVS